MKISLKHALRKTVKPRERYSCLEPLPRRTENTSLVLVFFFHETREPPRRKFLIALVLMMRYQHILSQVWSGSGRMQGAFRWFVQDSEVLHSWTDNITGLQSIDWAVEWQRLCFKLNSKPVDWLSYLMIVSKSSKQRKG